MMDQAEPLRMLVVDDSALYRQLVRNVLREVPGVDCVGAAKSGGEALTMIADLQPDLLTLDVQMPDVDGISVLKELRKRRLPSKAIMLSSFTAAGAQTTTDALLEGAFDFILKPSGRDAAANRQQLLAELTDKIAAYREHRRTSSRRQPAVSKEAAAPPGRSLSARALSEDPSIPRAAYEIVLIGTSTGGPPALRELLPQLPGDFPAPILIVQHMPAQFTHSLAARLNENSPLEVVEACDGMTLAPGFAYLAPGGRHMKLALKRGKLAIALADDPPEHGCRPAVDVLFRSAADVVEGPTIAVVLTGMGRDGVAGCRELKRRRGAAIIAQHPEGCVVYGMPKAVADERLHDAQLKLERIAPALVAAMRSRHDRP